MKKLISEDHEGQVWQRDTSSSVALKAGELRHRPCPFARLDPQLSLPTMTTPAPDMLFRAQFKVDLGHPPTLGDDLNGLYRLRERLRLASPKLANWYLGGS